MALHNAFGSMATETTLAALKTAAESLLTLVNTFETQGLTDAQLRDTPLAVSATDLDIRNLVFGTDKVDVSNSAVQVSNLPANQTVSGTVALDATTLSALENINVTVSNQLTGLAQETTLAALLIELQDQQKDALTNAELRASAITIQSTDLDIRNLSFATDKVDVSDSHIIGKHVISTLNSTTVPLAGNATYTGTWEEITDYVSVSLLVNTDSVATLEALKVDFSTDGVNLDRTVGVDLVTGGDYVSVAQEARFVRIRLTAGSAAQTYLRLQTHFSAIPESLKVTPIIDRIIDSTASLVTKGVIVGKTTAGGGSYVSVKVNPSGALSADVSGSTVALDAPTLAALETTNSIPVNASITPKSATANTAGNTLVHQPAAGKALRLWWYNLGAKPDNTAHVLTGLRFTTAGADFFSTYLSQYGASASHSFKAGQSFYQGGIDEGLYVNLDVAQTVKINIDFEEV